MEAHRQQTETLELLLGLAFHSMAEILSANETARGTWHIAAFNGHSSFGKVFPLCAMEGQLFVHKRINTAS